jgi:hypothetical protein
MNKVVAICLLRNEDRYLNRILTNICGFADEILLADHRSIDRTGDIARSWAEAYAHIHYRSIRHPGESHEWIRNYVNQQVWAFGVDGDEIYDPAGLARLKLKLQDGSYDHFRQLYGHAFHCDSLSIETRVASGYSTPPCRTITKLYNFNAYQDWAGPCPERFHGGHIVFNKGWNKNDNGWLYKEQSWHEIDFRCLHTVFLPRSSTDPEQSPPRQNISEQNARSLPSRIWASTLSLARKPKASQYKQEKYCRGDRLTHDVQSFFAQKEGP